jgi:dihydropteroate synthase
MRRGIRVNHPESLISVDTRSSVVAAAAVGVGADMINDVSGGRFDPLMFSTTGTLHVPLVLMHSRGSPETMGSMTSYPGGLVSDMSVELQTQLSAANAYIPSWLQYIDPGIGFAKTSEQNLLLLQPQVLREFKRLLHERPMLVGTSRKKFIHSILSRKGEGKAVSEEELDQGTAATSVAAVLGGADLLRVHEVRGVRRMCQVTHAIIAASSS